MKPEALQDLIKQASENEDAYLVLQDLAEETGINIVKTKIFRGAKLKSRSRSGRNYLRASLSGSSYQNKYTNNSHSKSGNYTSLIYRSLNWSRAKGRYRSESGNVLLNSNKESDLWQKLMNEYLKSNEGR